MTIGYNLTTFRGKKVEDYDADKGILDPANTCYRIRLSYDDFDNNRKLEDFFEKFAQDPKAKEVKEFIIGIWSYESEGCDELIATMIKYADVLQNVEAIVFGDITYEETEISWIENGDHSRLIASFPNLKEYRVRGGNSLSFKTLIHPKIEKFVVEAGGLDKTTVSQIITGSLPELQHLEIWLGTDNYGANANVHVLRPLLTGNKFPKLKYLGLRNSDISDDIADALSATPKVESSDIQIKDRVFVLTGTLATMKRNDAKKKLEALGATIGSGITKSTHYLVAGEKAGSKMEKAKKQGIPILSESDLIKILGDDNVSSDVSHGLESVLDRLEILDLSMGTLSDRGALALLNNPKILGLKKLDLHHHYLSDAMMKKVKALPIDVNIEDQEETDEDDGELYRYVSVGE